MDTSLLTTDASSDLVAAKRGKVTGDGLATGKVDKAPAAKRDRKAARVTQDAPVTTSDIETIAQDPMVTQEATVTVEATGPTIPEPAVPEATAEAAAPTVTEPKKPTKADLAKAIYDEAVQDPSVTRKDIIARFQKEAGLTTAGAQSYYYKFQQESGSAVPKGPTKMDKAREVYQALTEEGKARKDIIAALIKDVGLTQSGASTYYQSLKRTANKPTE